MAERGFPFHLRRLYTVIILLQTVIYSVYTVLKAKLTDFLNLFSALPLILNSSKSSIRPWCDRRPATDRSHCRCLQHGNVPNANVIAIPN